MKLNTLAGTIERRVLINYRIELRTNASAVEALTLDSVESTFFDDRAGVPAGSVELDHALLMRNIDHTWHRRVSLGTS